MHVALSQPSHSAALLPLQQRPDIAASRPRARHVTCSSAGSPPPLHRSQRQQERADDGPSLTRMQLVRGGLLAATGAMLGAAAPAQAVHAAAIEPAAAAAAAGTSAVATAAASQHFSKASGVLMRCCWCGHSTLELRAANACVMALPGSCPASCARACPSPPTLLPPAQVLLNTLADCELAVSVYPTFSYNAAGGGGAGSVTERADGLLNIRFDPASL